MTLPVRGSPGSGAWGDTIDADLALLDAHDHSAGKGLRITPSGLNINADLPFSSLWAPTQLHRIQFSAIAGAALAAGQRTSLFVSDGTGGLTANELYWHNNAGNKVQITAGNTLNFAAFVGGIGGDYTSVGATLNYTDSQKAYEFKEGTIDSHGWARLRSGDLRLLPFNTTGSVFVGMAAPGAIAGSYTVTWPLALPGSTALQQIDNTGQAIFSNTVPNAVTFSSAVIVSAGGIAVTGNSTVTGTLNVTGTLTNGETRTYSVALGIAGSGATVTVGGSPPAIGIGTATTGTMLPLEFKVGVTITAWEVRLIKNTDNTKTLSAKLWKGITPTQVGSTQSNSANAPGFITLGQSGLTDVVATQTAYFIEVVGSGTAGDIVTHYYQATTA
jgi:hypothetical protein